jgi:hypothetical protein
VLASGRGVTPASGPAHPVSTIPAARAVTAASSARVAVGPGRTAPRAQPLTMQWSTSETTAPAAGWPTGTSENGLAAGAAVGRPMARAAKMATVAREATSSGQNWPLPQPCVSPCAYAHSTSAKCGWPVGTSENVALAGLGQLHPIARTRKVTAAARVVRQPGQKYGGLALQPCVTPAARSASMASKPQKVPATSSK